MRSLFAFSLVAVSALAGSSAIGSTYNYEASYSGTIDHPMDAGCFFDCGRITIFGVSVEDLRGVDYRIDKSYYVSNVQTSTHGGDSISTWDETVRVSTTINGVTVTSFGTGSAGWMYDSNGYYYGNRDQWSYGSSFSGSYDGLAVLIGVSGFNYPIPGAVPVEGPLYSSFDITTEGNGARLKFGELDLHSGQVHADFRMISPVPVPASLPLMVTALIGLFFVNRRRTAKGL